MSQPRRRSHGTYHSASREEACGQHDAFEWYCFECGALVHRIEVKVTHLVKDLPPLYEAFFNDEKARTCKKCGAVHPGKKPPAGWGLDALKG